MTAVVDTNVVVSAAFWPKSEDRRCFVLLARRKCRLAVTEAILDEYRTLAARIGRRECPDKAPTPFLDPHRFDQAVRLGCGQLALGHSVSPEACVRDSVAGPTVFAAGISLTAPPGKETPLA